MTISDRVRSVGGPHVCLSPALFAQLVAELYPHGLEVDGIVCSYSPWCWGDEVISAPLAAERESDYRMRKGLA